MTLAAEDGSFGHRATAYTSIKNQTEANAKYMREIVLPIFFEMNSLVLRAH